MSAGRSVGGRGLRIDPSPAIRVGSVVEVTKGTRMKQRGVVLGEARSTYQGVPDLEVRMEDGTVRWLGPDVLRVLAAPPADSDDDVLASLRRAVPG
jgi:hypothetical protein